MPFVRILRWTGAILLAVALIIGAGLALLDTSLGQRFLTDRIAAYQTESGLSFRIQRIRGSVYGRMTLIGVSARDARGTFLTAPQIDVDWRPFAYLGNLIDVRSATAPVMRLQRLPALKALPDNPDTPLLPDIDIALGKLAIAKLVVDPAVTGRAHSIAIDGSATIADGTAIVSANATALRAANVAGGDTLTLRLNAVPARNHLQLAATLNAPVGGVADSALRLGRATMLVLDGRGDWQRWNGSLRGRSGSDAFADLALSARNGIFQATGMLQPAVLLPTTARLTTPRVGIDWVAALANRRADMRFAARSAALAIDGNGLIDFGRSRLENFAVAANLLRPSTLADSLSGDGVRLRAVLDGPVAKPALAYTLNAARLAFGSTGVIGLNARGMATIDPDLPRLPVVARAQAITGLNPSVGDLLRNVSLNGDLAWAGGRVLSDNLKLQSAKIDATAIVVADLANGRYTGALKGRVNDYRIAGLGRIRLVTDAQLVQTTASGFGLRGTFRIVTRQIENSALAAQLEGNADTTARFTFDQNGTATLNLLRLKAPGFRITEGSGRYNVDSGRIDFRATGVSRQYGPLTALATGTLARPDIRVRAARPGLGIGLRNVDARVQGVATGYAVTGAGSSDYGPVVADVVIRRGPKTAIDIRRSTVAGMNFTGSVAQTPTGPFAGRLAMTGSGLTGSVVLSAAAKDQRADIDATAAAAQIPGDTPITIGSGTIRATAILVASAPSVVGAFNLKDVRRGDAILTRAAGRVDYRSGAGRAAFRAEGSAGVPFAVAGQAGLTPRQFAANVSGTLNAIAFRLDRPMIADRVGAEWQVRPATVVLPQGRVIMAGRYGRTIALQSRLDNMDLSLVQAFSPQLRIGGRATGTIDYAGSASGNGAPLVKARLDIARFTRTSSFVVSSPVDIAMLGSLGSDGGLLRALVRRGGVIVGRVQARTAPLGSGARLVDHLDRAPLSGGIRYAGPADILWTLTGITGQSVNGPIAVAADFGGLISKPQLTGIVRGSGLRYDNETYGTTITAITMDGRFTQSDLQIRSFQGRAGSGAVGMTGTVGLDAARGFPVRIQVKLDNAQLARNDALGATATGALTITNAPDTGGLIKGELRLQDARYEFVRQGVAEVAELSGVRRKQPVGVAAPPALAPAPTFNWALDVRVRSDNQLFVRGLGLEAEWASDVRVTGTARDPRVTGALTVVRGTYSFAGRRFDLDNDGQIRFDGGAANNPVLDISASTSVEGVSANIDIAGRAQAPQIAFTSTPTLPQDEVLSRLLFGSSVTSLSPIQALQLAAALNSFRPGGGGGLDPLGKLRAASGISRLRILGADASAGRGTALAAGQYITNNVYVEVITDTRGFVATQIEISLSRALSLLSQTSSFGGSNAVIRYSKDY